MKYLVLALFSLLMTACASVPVSRYSIGQKIKPSVFYLTSFGGFSGGTGSQIKAPSGNVYILTNRHVCGLADSQDNIWVFTEDNRPVKRHVLERYWKADLCLVEPMPNTPAIELAEYGMLYDTPYFTVGHPQLYPLIVREGALVKISNIEVEYPEGVRDVISYLTDVTIYPGNSGSPLVDQDGKLVGVMYAGDNTQHNGVAVMLEQVKDFLKQW